MPFIASIEPVYRLPDGLTLRLHRGDEVLFTSTKHWLHPLFDLEPLLAEGLDPAGTVLADRITGLAAAHLVARMGIRHLRTQVLSRLAIPVLERHGIDTRCSRQVARIQCATESLLLDVADAGSAYALLRARRDQALAGR